MTRYIVLPLFLLSIGCQSIKRITDGAQQTSPAQAQINPDNFMINGTTTKDNESVYTNVTDRTITVEVLKAGAWIVLQRPDIYDYLDSYQLFTIPQQGIRFGNLAYKDENGAVHFTSELAAPTGTQYRIHSVKA